jgi:ABC-type transport system involved in multi-copper enzyme maturation permease subunit
MYRFFFLTRFEITKLLSQKKAFLFLLALNIVPLLSSFLAFLVYLKVKGWGVGNLEFSALQGMVRGIFLGHIKFFAFISPFFLALIIAESISGESGRGHLKTLLLTPVPRWQVIVTKAISFLLFLLLAVSFGGLFLQVNLWVARALTDEPKLLAELTREVSSALVDTSTALQILSISFISNLTMVGYFVLISLFFESPIVMTFCSLIVLMGMETFVTMAPYLAKVDPLYGRIADWCFTRHISHLCDFSIISDVLENKLSLSSPDVSSALLASMGWAGMFFLLALFFFQRKNILN